MNRSRSCSLKTLGNMNLNLKNFSDARFKLQQVIKTMYMYIKILSFHNVIVGQIYSDEWVYTINAVHSLFFFFLPQLLNSQQINLTSTSATRPCLLLPHLPRAFSQHPPSFLPQPVREQPSAWVSSQQDRAQGLMGKQPNSKPKLQRRS